MATIQKVALKSGGYSYRCFVRLAGHKPITKQFKTKKEALEFARTVEGNKDLAFTLGNPATKNLNLNTLIDEFLKEYSGNDHNMVYRLQWWGRQCGKIIVGEITHQTVRWALKKLSDDGRSGPTLNRYKAAISSVFEWAKEVYGINGNPARQVKARPESKKRVRFLSEDERTRLLKACMKSDWQKLYLLVLLAITTGARKTEMLKIRWCDLDMKNRTASIYDTKNGSNRVLPITDEVMQELSKFRGIGKGYIFESPATPELYFVDFRSHWNKAIKEAGIEDFRFHDLRHTCASYLAQNGANLLQIAEVLGHSNTVVTGRYAHLCIDHKRDLVESVFNKIGL